MRANAVNIVIDDHARLVVSDNIVGSMSPLLFAKVFSMVVRKWELAVPTNVLYRAVTSRPVRVVRLSMVAGLVNIAEISIYTFKDCAVAMISGIDSVVASVWRRTNIDYWDDARKRLRRIVSSESAEIVEGRYGSAIMYRHMIDGIDAVAVVDEVTLGHAIKAIRNWDVIATYGDVRNVLSRVLGSRPRKIVMVTDYDGDRIVEIRVYENIAIAIYVNALNTIDIRYRYL